MSKIKDSIVSSILLDEMNIQGYFPMAYDSLRELMEAVCILHEQKVTNHECLGKLVKKIQPNFDLYMFERLRYARNGINYYGTKIDFNQAKSFIRLIVQTNNELRKYLLKMKESSRYI